jgi:hypothetical protein
MRCHTLAADLRFTRSPDGAQSESAGRDLVEIRCRPSRRAGLVGGTKPRLVARGLRDGWVDRPQLRHLPSGAGRYALSHVTRSITRQSMTVLSLWPILGPVSDRPNRAHEVRTRSQSLRPSAFLPGVVKVADMGMGYLPPDVGSIHVARVSAAIAEVFTEIVRWLGR